MQILFLYLLRLVILIKAALNCKAVICKQIVAAVVYDFLIKSVTEFHYLFLFIHRRDCLREDLALRIVLDDVLRRTLELIVTLQDRVALRSTESC